jgi:hypothetical protein
VPAPDRPGVFRLSIGWRCKACDVAVGVDTQMEEWIGDNSADYAFRRAFRDLQNAIQQHRKEHEHG